MTDDAALRAAPFFAALERVELARMVGGPRRSAIRGGQGHLQGSRVTRDAAGEELFSRRQALVVGVIVTLLTVVGLAVAIG